MTSTSLARQPTTAPATRRRLPFLWLVLGIAFVVYLPAVFNEFVEWDDVLFIVQNPRLNPPTLDTLRYYWTHAEYLYQPMTFTLWAALAKASFVQTPDAMGSRLNPYVFHLASVALHLIATAAVYRILRRAFGEGLAAAAGALLFALHPLQVESVAFIGAMNTPLAAALGLSALALYLEANAGTDANVPRRRRGRLAVATTLFVLAMLAKPTAVVIPALAFVLDVAINRRSLAACFRSVLPWLVLAIPCVIWTHSIQSAPPTADELVPVWSRPLIAAHSVAFYLWKIVIPYPLGIDYGLTPVRVWSEAWSRVAWIIPAALLAAAGLRWGRWPAFWAGVVIFMLAMLPNSGLVRFDYEYVSTTADRYVYLSMLGAALVFASILSTIGTRTVAAGVAAAAVAMCAWITLGQIRTWHDGRTLFTHALAVNPRSWLARADLASLVSDHDPDRAIALNREAIALNPEYWYARNNLAAVLVDRAPDDAIEQSRYVLAHQPTYASAWNNLGCALQRKGDWPGARDAFARGHQLAPDNAVLAANYAAAVAAGTTSATTSTATSRPVPGPRRN